MPPLPITGESLLQQQILTLDTVVAAATDKGEKTRLEEKLQRLRQELSIVQERQALEAREQSLRDDRPTGTLDQLRTLLRGFETTMADAEVRLRALAERRIAVVSARDALASQIASRNLSTGATAERQAEAEDRMFTINEELRVLAFEQEATEGEIALVRDADHVRELLKLSETAEEHPSLRSLFDAYNELKQERKSGSQLAALMSDLDQNLAINQASMEVSRQKLAKFDEELALLEKQTGFFRRDPKIERLMAHQRSQKAALVEVLPKMIRQVEAIQHSKRALAMRQSLDEATKAWQEEKFTQARSAYYLRLRWPAVILVSLVILHFVLAYLVLPVFRKNETLFLSRRLLRYGLILVGTVSVAGFLFDDLTTVAATLGIVSAALVISLQDVFTSIAGWFVITIGGKFGIGDRLEIDGTRGDVLDIELLRTTMLEINAWLGMDQPTGRVIVIPNNFIFKNKVFNFTHGHPFIWGKIDVTVTFATPVASAMSLFKRILEEETADQFADAKQAASKMQRRYGVPDADYVPKIYTHIADSGVTLTLVFVAHYRKFSATRNRINRRLVAELETRRHIQMAYNTFSVLTSAASADGPSAVLGSDLTTPPFARPPN